MFKIGIGPSSSHTLGPWKAAQQFANRLITKELISYTHRIEVHLYGSLALTGHGHGTDLALMMGLMNIEVEHTNSTQVELTRSYITTEKSIKLGGIKEISFDPDHEIRFEYDTFLDYHSNGLRFYAFDDKDLIIYEKTYYSVGGGFVVEEGEEPLNQDADTLFPYAINSSKELLTICEELDCSISHVVMENEKKLRSKSETELKLRELWEVMSESAWQAVRREGVLPGGLFVTRRAAKMNKSLLPVTRPENREEWLEAIEGKNYSFNQTLDWISTFALAINEENASFGRVVTAPTNGDAGVVPAVLFYHLYLSDHEKNPDDLVNYLLVAGEMGSLFKKGATISAAMGGCQAEIGVSSAMAAAGLTEVRGGSPAQCLMAAEIAMEHHLGLTCDPIKGLVQVPCIERNSIGAIKAISASNLAMKGDPSDAKVTLDDVIKSMWKTAQAMHSDYKETSKGGLAITVGMTEC